MIDYKLLYQKRYTYSKSDLINIAIEHANYIRSYYGDSTRAENYIKNVLQVALYADSSCTYDEYNLYLKVTGHQVSQSKLKELGAQAWFVELGDTIPEEVYTQRLMIPNATIVLSIAMSLIDGSLNRKEIQYLNKLIGFNFI